MLSVTAANSIYPTAFADAELRRKHQDNAIVESLNKEAVSVYKAYWEYKRRVGEIVAEEGKYTKRRDKSQRILNKVTKESSDE